MKMMMAECKNFFRKEAVLCIAALLALCSAFFIPPSADYISYLDFRVLALLFGLMLVVAGLQSIGFFLSLGSRILSGTRNTRQLALLLVALCFFSSMFITNDVALLTFVPFAVLTLSMACTEKLLVPIIVLQTIAANLGSMLTPIGNPQNLYLYSFFEMSMGSFLKAMLPLTVLSFLLLTLAVFLLKKETFSLNTPQQPHPIPRKPLAAYLTLFAVCLACVMRLLDYRLMLLILVVSVFCIDRKLFGRVDYYLLLTFVCFFIFIGNMGKIPAISELMYRLLSGRELLLGILLSQCISNVPAAILLSGFTENAVPLLYGVNIGGLGTLIASLASVISYRLYKASDQTGNYMKVFTLYNLAFLLPLVLVGWMMLSV